MTNELEKQFFKEFDIKLKDFKHCNWDSWCPYPDKIICDDACPYFKTYMRGYPEITPNILLKLICILTRFYGELVLEQCLDVNDLKEQILNIFIRTSYKDNFKHQVRTLFEEG